MRKFIIATISLFVLIACSEETKESRPTFEEFKYQSVVDGQYSINIVYQRIANTNENITYARIDTLNYYHTFIDFIDDPITDIDLDAMAKLIEQSIKESQPETAGGDHIYTIEQRPLLQRGGSVLCFETYYSSHTGGIHPNEALIYHCYDLTNGLHYTFDYLLEEGWAEAMRSLICKHLNAECEQYGTTVTPETIHIPASVLITDSGITLVYQPYEIAPYNAGHISIDLTDKEIAATGAPLVWKH